VSNNFQHRYYNLPEEEMQLLVKKAQEGCPDSQEQLLEVFANYLSKYTALLEGGKLNLNDYDLRRFVSLFMKDPQVRRHLIGNRLNTQGWAVVQECLRGITYMVNRYGDHEDVDQTVKMAFLHCVNVYKPRGEIPFSAYLYSYFFYVLKKQVDTLLIHQLGRKSYPLRDSEDEWDDEDSAPSGFPIPPSPGADELMGAEALDELWIQGETAFGPFAALTIHERQLLKWRYVDGERASSIARRVAEHPNNVREILARVKAKLLEASLASA
jgi:DNA-directed RNA polymerase specialized sigma24 family protein